MNDLFSMFERMTERMARAISGDIRSQLNQAIGRWRDSGGHVGYNGSSPGVAVPPGNSRGRDALKPSASPIIAWFQSVNNWLMSHTRSWIPTQFQTPSGIDKQSKSASHFRVTSGINKPIEKSSKQQGEAPSRPTLLDRFLGKLESRRPDQFQIKSTDLNAKTPEGLFQQALSLNKQKSWFNQQNTRWSNSRRSPFAQIGRAKQLALRAARRYQSASKRRDALSRVRDSAQQRFMAAPRQGEAGYNADRSASLLKQFNIAASAYSKAASNAGHALNRLSQTSAKYAQSTNVAAGAMRMVASAMNRFGLLGTAALTSMYVGGKIGATWPEKLGDIGGGMAENRRGMAAYSWRQKMAFNAYDLSKMETDTEVADRTAGSTKRLLESVNKFNNTIVPHRVAQQNLLNAAGQTLMEGGSDAANVMEALSKGGLGGLAALMADPNKAPKNPLTNFANSLVEGGLDQALEQLKRMNNPKEETGGTKVFSNTVDSWIGQTGVKDEAARMNRAVPPIKPIR